MRILIIEDNRDLAGLMQDGLKRMGHGVDAVHDGRTGLSYARLNPYDVVILDRMLPKLDGLSVLKELRAEQWTTHVLMLTAMDAIPDRVEGLESGADDYLVKPFDFNELVARLDALHRRSRGHAENVIEVGELKVDIGARRAEQAGHRLDLSGREFAVLRCLAMRHGQTVSRIEIEDAIYDEHSLPMSNVVAVTVCTLREKMEQHGPRVIQTRRGLGYVLDVPSA